MGETVFMAADALTDDVRGPVPLANAQWGPALNAGYSITGSINPKTVGRDLVEPYATIIYVYRNGRLFGGAIVDQLQPQDGTQELRLVCSGFETYPSSQFLMDSLEPAVYADPLDIAREFWTYMQSQPDSDLGVQMGTETTNGKVAVGTPSDPYRRDWWDTKSIGSYLADLMSADDGFDQMVTVTAHDDGSRTKRLWLGYPRLGSRRPDIQFDDRVNVVALPGDNTIAGPVTDVIVTGSGTGRSMRRAHAGRRGLGHLRRMYVEALASQTNHDRLRARARADLTAMSVSIEVSQLALRQHPEARLGALQVGDDVRTTLTKGWNNYTGWMRVMGWQLVEAAGNQTEQIIVDVARSDQFVYGPDPNVDASSATFPSPDVAAAMASYVAHREPLQGDVPEDGTYGSGPYGAGPFGGL